jgi:tetratricopeptide (TPR) repeat protein
MSPDTPTQSQPSVADLLGDGIRYLRGGVTNRARDCFEEVARRADRYPEAAAEALWQLANLHRLHSEWDEALNVAHRSGELAREHGLQDIEANAANIEGAIWWARGDYQQALTHFQRSLELSCTHATRGKALQNLASLAAVQGNFVDAHPLFVASREEYRSAGDARGEAVSILNIGRLQMDLGEVEQAEETLTSAVMAAKHAGDIEMLAAAQVNLGIALGRLGRTGEAEERITTAYGQFTIANIPAQRVQCLTQLASLAVRRNDTHGARVCLTHARTVAEAAGLPLETREIDDQLAALKD